MERISQENLKMLKALETTPAYYNSRSTPTLAFPPPHPLHLKVLPLPPPSPPSRPPSSFYRRIWEAERKETEHILSYIGLYPYTDGRGVLAKSNSPSKEDMDDAWLRSISSL